MLPQVRLIVRTLKVAMPDLLKLLFTAAPFMVLTTLAHVQILSRSYSTFSEGFVVVTRMLTSPPPYVAEDYRSVPLDANLSFHLDNFFVRLVAGSFATAILVRALNLSREGTKSERARQPRLSAAYAELPAPSWPRQAMEVGWFLLTWRFCGTWSHSLSRSLTNAAAKASDSTDESDAKQGQPGYTMLCEADLRRHARSERVTHLLMARFAVARTVADATPRAQGVQVAPTSPEKPVARVRTFSSGMFSRVFTL